MGRLRALSEQQSLRLKQRPLCRVQGGNHIRNRMALAWNDRAGDIPAIAGSFIVAKAMTMARWDSRPPVMTARGKQGAVLRLARSLGSQAFAGLAARTPRDIAGGHNTVQPDLA